MKKITNLVPDYMPMGETGMSEMTDMSEMMDMPLPKNTLPMMMGNGQFGSLEMGGMFTTVKVRDGLAKNDYKNPGDYKNPSGTVAHAVEVDTTKVLRQKFNDKDGFEVNVRKPTNHSGH